MNEIMSGYRDYKAAIGGVSIGAMLVMAWLTMRRLPDVPAAERGAYKLYTLYLVGGVVIVSIFLFGYLQTA